MTVAAVITVNTADHGKKQALSFLKMTAFSFFLLFIASVPLR